MLKETKTGITQSSPSRPWHLITYISKTQRFYRTSLRTNDGPRKLA